MSPDRIGDFVCLQHREGLRLAGAAEEDGAVRRGRLVCSKGCSYPIEDGVPSFVRAGALSAVERKNRDVYDRAAAEIYDNAIDWQFAATYENEDEVRESMVDMLDLTPGMRVLEIGCGTGRDSFRLGRRLGDQGLLHMLDISSGIVRECIRQVSGRKDEMECELAYSTASALSLPFPDGFFDAVFHFGAFNFFGDLPKAAAELTRVTRLDGRIVIGDEAVAPWLAGSEFEGIVTTNNPIFKARTPIDALPVSARDVTLRWVIANCFYVISFRKGDGPPPLNLDLPHKGWRGGTMRTRYYGLLEGVTPETKALARSAAQKMNISVHEWLERVVGAEADRVLAAQPSRRVNASQSDTASVSNGSSRLA